MYSSDPAALSKIGGPAEYWVALVITKPFSCVELTKHEVAPVSSPADNERTVHVPMFAVAVSLMWGSHMSNSAIPVADDEDG